MCIKVHIEYKCVHKHNTVINRNLEKLSYEDYKTQSHVGMSQSKKCKGV